MRRRPSRSAVSNRSSTRRSSHCSPNGPTSPSSPSWPRDRSRTTPCSWSRPRGATVGDHGTPPTRCSTICGGASDGCIGPASPTGRSTPSGCSFEPDRTLVIGDFGRATGLASDADVQADRAQLLVTTALALGTDRAVAVAARALDDGALTGLLPYLQEAALSHSSRSAVEAAELDLDSLRKAAASAAATEVPDLVPLRRVTWGSLLQIALIGIAAWVVISTIAGVGVDTIVDELSTADWTWLLFALVDRTAGPGLRGVLDDRRRAHAAALRAGAAAAVRDPVHRPGGPVIGRADRRERPLLPTSGRADGQPRSRSGRSTASPASSSRRRSSGSSRWRISSRWTSP